MLIRTAHINDIVLIHQLANEIWWHAYKGIITDDQISFMLENMYSETALRQQFDYGMKFLISERDGQPTGFAAYSIEDAVKRIFKLHKLYILPSEQGKGTGKQLIELIERLAISENGIILELNVNRNNQAFEFYKKLGFKVIKTVDIPYHQYVLNDYVMHKSLH
jgi:GNAT superfamily N-acetyltransferase